MSFSSYFIKGTTCPARYVFYTKIGKEHLCVIKYS